MCNKAGGTWGPVMWESRAWHELRGSRKLKILLSIRKHLINEYEHATISSVPRTWADSMRDRVQLFYTCLAFQRTSMILETTRERERVRDQLRARARLAANRNSLYDHVLSRIRYIRCIRSVYGSMGVLDLSLSLYFVLFFVSCFLHYFLQFFFSSFYIFCKQSWGLFLNIYGVASYTIPY